MLITQARDNIFKLSKRLKLTNHYVLLTGAIVTLNMQGFYIHLMIRKNPLFEKYSYLRLRTTFSSSLKG